MNLSVGRCPALPCLRGWTQTPEESLPPPRGHGGERRRPQGGEGQVAAVTTDLGLVSTCLFLEILTTPLVLS